ncbi:hypothetical protein ACFQNF_07460 [Iodobacter arcticus]|uniref:Uncharacterized protein n=1 Tax=Iodobacter arcticus TaxID=590593 RepID=A0ABW2QVG8_9NEIS
MNEEAIPAAPAYLDAHNWAKLCTYLWMRPIFADQFERDPVKAILAAQGDAKNPIELDYVFDLNDPARRTKLLKIPDNPGYASSDLYDAIFGLLTIVPMTSWNVHGVTDNTANATSSS